MVDFEVHDFNQCDKLIKSIANKQYYGYISRVSFPKLEFDDFYQNGWVAMQDCINKRIYNLDYICVAIRRSMYRGVEKSSLIQTSNKKELWYYISGHEDRMENSVGDEGKVLADIIPSTENIEDKVVTHVLVGQVFNRASKEDTKELIRIMNDLPPERRKVRENAKKRSRSILEGKNPYKASIAPKQSSLSGVCYDKSKDRWVFTKRIEGKRKVFIRSRDKRIVEEFAKNYYKTVMV